ncbi:hypothetical protein [Agromyces neolithicus]
MTNLPRRPDFHFTPERGWINDPLGLTYRDDRYHLFYQYAGTILLVGARERLMGLLHENVT